MRHLFPKLIFISSFFILFGCKKNETSEVAKTDAAKNSIEYASGLSIVKYDDYSVVTVSNPWPNANKDFKYVLKEKEAKVPDSLQAYTSIQIPLESVVVTSTTNIPFLEMLEVENKLVGFPHTDYISSEKTRALIDKGSVKNVGQNEKLNIEQLIELSPDLIVTFGVDNNNPMLDNLKKSGLNILIQGDWMEQSPLGKAEWIKLYGALFGKEEKAKELFDKIVQSYEQAKKLAAEKEVNSTVLYGSMYEDVWYVAKGNSWVAEFMKDAHANYLWADLKGTGSEGLSFEKVLDKAKTASVWIASGSFKSLDELQKANPHYGEFDAFKNKNVYSFEGKLGATGGTVYYELAPSRPDLVLKDYIKIFHPDLLPSYEFTFASKLN
ncbi:ABC transporter substrate-binding protein [Flavobacterium johnsoniae]|uniref:Periplasmic binding protein n=1 Tax=Flavobacterium johnsoniae (strain ATCC 17061 / DSM 2064 / JCM 8514 / BCRC 14874 / CCUG 350202 / NBRC 14942 / NCIMB 11054 / UW101) TaxID=376686 RepID=A5FNV3_FLAJ1|nr:ABC transporter substrate-binding protein [Flavobacterium johnsoniae]ABQ03121.1 periplasmic binding protein [Flavobacterium johnsoniae UW101]OXG01445.1 ABC transporter substrate-binding protein [Flavobacterium johnsoniae UW101]WQG80016.1 ABC transporter substrate-binding protein [Flavobacterium johnsoniae UW101]SHL84617.1 iron complex transport system substrate-binding protein [Flavobacterium johnsoniae]